VAISFQESFFHAPVLGLVYPPHKMGFANSGVVIYTI
jgi:hypothetical protein